MVELKSDLTGVKVGGVNDIVIRNASAPAGDDIMLGAEGSQLFKHDGKYYLFNITWPRGGMRTVVIHRAEKITGPWEGRIGLQDQGVAQGGMIDTPKGDWYAYMFQDHGAVGRIPYLVPLTWKDGWPVLGVDGRVPMKLELPVNKGPIPGIVDSDEFERNEGERPLPLVWQWNHNPDNTNWSLAERPGYLRITTGRVDSDLLSARNTLTQRTIGPESTATVAINTAGLKDGDVAGLCLLQQNYGLVGVQTDGGSRQVIMINGSSPQETVRSSQQPADDAESGPRFVEAVPLTQNRVYLRGMRFSRAV